MMVLKTSVDFAWRTCGGMEFQSLMAEGREDRVFVGLSSGMGHQEFIRRVGVTL